MITPTELRLKSERLWSKYLQSKIDDDSFFPQSIPCNKSVPERFDHFQRDLTALINASKKELGYGYSITLKEAQTRRFGLQYLPDKITFDTESDFLNFLDKTEESEIYQQEMKRLLEHFPNLKPWLYKNPLKVIEFKDSWPDLIQVLIYYQSNPRPGLYPRQVPLPISTKCIETHKTILDQLLAVLCPEAFSEGDSFEARWGFCNKPRHFFRLRLLDPLLRNHLMGIESLSLSLEQLQSTQLPGKNILIVENEMTFLTLPALPDTIAIWGHGNQVQVLRSLAWLHNRQLWYWGDIDTHGLRILFGLRLAFPHLQALWMDRLTLERYRTWVQTSPYDPHPLPDGLIPAETDLFTHLQRHRLRLEQEHIPQADVDSYLHSLFIHEY